MLSILDLAPITEGHTAADALRNSRDLAQHAERWGYERVWLAEHHNMSGVASAATAVAIGFVAEGTKTIRVGAGGVMLPNHAPLVVAEQFGTLASLYPGRIELGLGRAPGTDANCSRALRRNLAGDVDDFPNDVAEVMHYFRPAEPGQLVRAVPGEGTEVPVWILGSSLFGASLAAAFGLPFGFASHFAPAMLDDAVALYRERFQPSPVLERPRVMVGVNVFAADTAGEARTLSTSMMQAFVNIRRGQGTKLPPPRPGYHESLNEVQRAQLDEMLSCSVVGTVADVRSGLQKLQQRTGADDLIVASMIYDHTARLRSYELAAQAFGTGLR